MRLFLFSLLGFFFISGELFAWKRIPLIEKKGASPVKYAADAKDRRKVMLPPYYTPKRGEFRGLWVVTAWNLDFPKCATPYAFMRTYKNLLYQAKRKGINTILFQVRPNCDAFYPSRLNPWSQNLTGQQARGFRSFDPLAYMIKETHNAGLAFHAWLNPYRLRGATPLSKRQLLARLPRWHFARKNPSAVLSIPTKKGNLFMLDPGHPLVMQHLMDTVRELVNKYPLDGLCIDDYFYPYEGIKDQDLATYRKWNPWRATLPQWRCNNINMMIRNLSGIVRGARARRKSKIQFGVSPFGIWMNYKNHKFGSLTKGHESLAGHYADTRLWVKKGFVDYIAPQLYWSFSHNSAPFACLADWWANTVKGTRVKLYIGLTLQNFAPRSAHWSHPRILQNQLLYLSAIPEVRGVTLFSANGLITPANKTAKTNLQNALRYW